MQAKIALITIFTDHVPDMLEFYKNALGFQVLINLGQYVELQNEGVRFAICDRDVMLKATHHESYTRRTNGQAFELAFPCDSPEDVDQTYTYLIDHGAVEIQPPMRTEWGQRTAFFADPEGNIYEIFSELPAP